MKVPTISSDAVRATSYIKSRDYDSLKAMCSPFTIEYNLKLFQALPASVGIKFNRVILN